MIIQVGEAIGVLPTIAPAASSTRCSARCSCAPQGRAAWRRFNEASPRAASRPRGARRRARHLRRRAAAHAGLRHRHPRRCSAAAADPRVVRRDPRRAGSAAAGIGRRVRRARVPRAGRRVRVHDVDGTAHEVDPRPAAVTLPARTRRRAAATGRGRGHRSPSATRRGRLRARPRRASAEDGAQRARRVLFPAPIRSPRAPRRRRPAPATRVGGVDAAGVTHEPSRAAAAAWSVRSTDGDGPGFDLERQRVSPAAEPRRRRGRHEGLRAAVPRRRGRATGRRRARASTCLGQRGHSWGVAGLGRIGARAHGRRLAATAPRSSLHGDPPRRRQAPRRRGGGGAILFDGEPRASRSPSRALDHLRRRGPPAPRGPGALGRRRGLPPPRRGRGRVRHVARPRAPAPGLRVLRAGAWRAARASGATTSCAAR